jgi:hypothetical protein
MSLSSLANDSDRDASDKSQAAASDAAAPPATTTTTTTATDATPPVARDDGRRALLVDETAPSPSAPHETRKRRNTRILDSEDSLSLAPDTPPLPPGAT